MRIDTERLKRLVELCDVPFEERFLEIDSYRNKKDKLSLMFRGNFCFEADRAFENGLLKDFEIKGLVQKESFRLVKIAEYSNGKSYDRDETNAGHMEIIFVYKASCDFCNIFVACKTNITFPMLIRYVVTEQFSKILLPPYISHVEVWACESFNELMHNYPYSSDIFYLNKRVNIELCNNALFMLQLYGLDSDSERCLMHIDDGNFTPRYTINIDDLRRRNYNGMYYIRPYLRA